MPLPDTLTTCTVTGAYTAPDGAALGGQLTFVPSSKLLDSGSLVIADSPLIARLQPGSGSFSITLLCTDNAGITPEGWQWKATVLVPGVQGSFNFLLPSTLGASVDISHLTPAGSPPPAGSTFVSSINGQAGAVELAAGFGILPPAGDLSGSTLAPTVTATHLSAPLPIAQGGTGAGSGSAALTALGGVSAASPALTGTPTAPTAAALTASTQLATTAYADSAVGVEAARAAAAEALKLAKASNLSDLASAATARTNLGLGTAAVLASTAVAQTANNLSDLANAGTARTNLGLGTAATQASSAFDAAGSAAAAQTASTTALGEFSAIAHGADPTGTADSTTAIQAAQAAALAAGGGYVTLGPGTFKFGTITIAGVSTGSSYLRPPLVHFRFAGAGATILTPLSANQPLFQVQSGKFSAGVRFEGGFTVKAHASGSTGPAINLTSARQWVIESPAYLDSLSGGVGTPGTYAQVIGLGVDTYGCRVVNPACESQTLGACFVGSIDNTAVVANSNSIENPLFEGNTAPHMIDAAGTIMLTITDGIIEGNSTTSAIRLGWMTTVRNCYFEQGAAAGISFSMNAAGVDNPGLGYDPGQCWLENNIHASNPDTLVIPSGVHPYTTLIFTPAFGSAFIITDNTSTLIQVGSGSIVLPPSTTLLNNAAGGTNGTTVTTGNSGGGSGNAFNAVVTGSGLTFDNTETVAPSALAYKLVASASLPGVSWNVPATMGKSAAMYMRAYVYFGSAFDTAVLSSAGLWYALRVSGGNWNLRANPGTAAVGPAVSANTWYRVEMTFTPASGTCSARIYNLSGTLLASLSSSGGTQATIATVFFGPLSSVTGTMWLGAVGLTNATWLGPAVPTDQAAGDIQPLGTQAAGSLGVPADAAHVHTLPRLDQVATPTAAVGLGSQKITSLANGTAASDGTAFGQLLAAEPPFLPSDVGYLAWNLDPADCATVKVSGAGAIILTRINVRSALSVTNVVLAITTAGATLTSAENFAGLFSSAGTLIASTADQSSSWTSTGVKSMALAGGPYALTPGFYWVGYVSNGTTQPTFLAGSTQTAAINAGLTVSTARAAFNGSGITALASITPSANAFNGGAIWAALS